MCQCAHIYVTVSAQYEMHTYAYSLKGAANRENFRCKLNEL